MPRDVTINGVTVHDVNEPEVLYSCGSFIKKEWTTNGVYKHAHWSNDLLNAYKKFVLQNPPIPFEGSIDIEVHM